DDQIEPRSRDSIREQLLARRDQAERFLYFLLLLVDLGEAEVERLRDTVLALTPRLGERDEHLVELELEAREAIRQRFVRDRELSRHTRRVAVAALAHAFDHDGREIAR